MYIYFLEDGVDLGVIRRVGVLGMVVWGCLVGEVLWKVFIGCGIVIIWFFMGSGMFGLLKLVEGVVEKWIFK